MKSSLLSLHMALSLYLSLSPRLFLGTHTLSLGLRKHSKNRKLRIIQSYDINEWQVKKTHNKYERFTISSKANCQHSLSNSTLVGRQIFCEGGGGWDVCVHTKRKEKKGRDCGSDANESTGEEQRHSIFFFFFSRASVGRSISVLRLLEKKEMWRFLNGATD